MVNNNIDLSVYGIEEMRGGEYLLSDYEVSDYPKLFKDGKGIDCSIQYYQKKHKNEYVIKSGLGDCCLYKNGLLKMIWKEDVDGNRMGEFVSFDKGRISFIQNFDNLLNGNEWIRIINDKRGECMEIWKGDVLVYRGEYNDEFGREGMGMVYNEENGDIEYEGVFVDNELVRICKIFEGNEMMEFVDNGNNVDVVNQIPIYVGGYIVDENDGLFKRNGLGYLIDVDKRIATRECIYENGVELNGIDLIDGWYRKKDPNMIQKYPNPVSYPYVDVPTIINPQVRISNSNEFNRVSRSVRELIICSNSCNELTSLNLNEYRYLKSIEIGNDCFMNVDVFHIDGLNELKSLKIGSRSFSTIKSAKDWNSNKVKNDCSRSFGILNCGKLESVEIGRFSFVTFGDKFELDNLPSLSTIKIGSIETDYSDSNNNGLSLNFYHSLFVIKGIINIDIANE